MNRQAIFTFLAAIAVVGLLCGCSTKKNTGMTRFYHAFTARYNTTFNGQQAFLEGLMAQEKGHKDDYTVLLPMYTAANKATAGMGKSNYDRAIEKAEKAIKKHSIKVKPVRKGNKRMSDKEKAWRNRREFNSFLKRPWLMLAESQFRKGEFIEAASTYSYIIRLYADQPDVVSVAKAWLARCYVELEWPYDAEDVLRKAARDSMSVKGRREYEKSQAAYCILTGQYAEALPGLRTAAKHEPRPIQRARLNFLLGQVAQLAKDNKTAYKAWQKVIASSPPYELAFNARLRQAEVLSNSATGRAKVLRKLRRMARSDKNSEYLDQVYHAIGNVYLSAGDTLHAVYAMKTGVEKATQSGAAKTALMLHLGQLYWDKENYIDAAEMYGQCASALDQKHAEYAETQRRADILKQLAPPLGDVKLQDSLLLLSEMSEADRNAAIDRVIKELKRKEKEEAKKRGDQEGGGAAQQAGNNQPQNSNQPPPATNPITKPGEKGAWYFYNPQTVLQGKRAFMQQWGNRKLEDNWRRSNKQAEGGDEAEGYDYYEGELPADSLDTGEADALADSLANDPHHREYYLKQIPFDDDAKAVAHATIAKGLFTAGLLEITPLENYPLAERTLQRLVTDYPDFEQMPDVYYNMFLLFGRQNMVTRAMACRDTIVSRWPEHDYARLLLNPRYEQNARNGKHIEDSLYATAYEFYTQAQYKEVVPLFDIHSEDFPNGPHRGRFLFVRAMSALYEGDNDSFFETMKTLTDNYASDSLSVWAKGIVQGVQEGRLLNADGMDMGSLWSRHEFGDAADSTATDGDNTLLADRLTDFVFVLAWPANTLDSKQLLYEVARYNFSTFVARNFEIETIDKGPVHQLLVRGFTNYDEVHSYVQSLYLDAHMRDRLDGIRSLMISEHNLKLLGRRYSYDEYYSFFEQNFAPQAVPENLLIDEPDVEIIDPENVEPDSQDGEEEEESGTTTDDFDWPW